jgi:hypothetical protein
MSTLPMQKVVIDSNLLHDTCQACSVRVYCVKRERHIWYTDICSVMFELDM